MTEWLSSIGPAVGNHLWQSTAFAAVVWLTTLFLRRNQARVRYGLWLAASVKFLIPFSLLVGLGSLLPKSQHIVVAVPVGYAMDTVAQPFTETLMDFAPVVVQASPMQRFEHMIPLALGIIWLCGVMVVLAVWGVRWRQVAKTLRRAVLVENGREWEILRRLHKAMGAGWQIPLLMSQKLMEPGMFGIFRPVLIWPERLSERLNDEHIEAILAHELRHARRKDNLTAVIHMMVEAAFWFHPLVWWVERRMVEERERACDEAVVEMGSRPGIYAESLLKACRFCVESPLVCVSGITGADLSKRVLSIMTLRLERMGVGKKVALALFGLIVIATPILLGQSEGAQRVMAVALQSAPAPIRAVAHAMIAEEQTHSTALIAELQPNPEVPHAAQATSQPEVRYGMAEIRIPQPDAPAVITSVSFGISKDDIGRNDNLVGARIDSKSKEDIVFFRMGWAYVLPSGLEFVKGETVVPYNGIHSGGTFGIPEWHVPLRKDATALLIFLEEVALDHGTRWEADHKQIEAYYKSHSGSERAMQEVDGAEVGAMQAAPNPSPAAPTPTPVSTPTFDVASVRQAAPPGPQTTTAGGVRRISGAAIVTVTSDRASYRNITLKSLLMSAYDLKPFQISGPAWIDSEHYDIVAKIPEGAPKEEVPVMLQNLLAERFRMTLHSETKDHPGFILGIGKGGPKLILAKNQNPASTGGFTIKDNLAVMNFNGATMLAFADDLSRTLGRPVIDSTGLPGKFDIALPVSMGVIRPGAQETGADGSPVESDSSFASLFTAVHDLGLKLDAGKVPLKCIVVDKAEKIPTEN
jgi:uncharacterized protein (TIGR03435 family)